MGGLDRFVAAQARSHTAALAEVRAGRKTSHWMWFVFPQLAVLGYSDTAKFYGIADLAEARAYLAHPVLGPRLSEVMTAMLAHRGVPAVAILGDVDAMKLCSSATLFEAAGGPGPWAEVLDAFCAGRRCARTLAALAAE